MSVKLLKCFKTVLRSFYLYLRLLGVDPRKSLQLKYALKFLNQRKDWKQQGGQIDRNHVILSDYGTNAGTMKGHYFHQDLLVAQFIYQNNPKRHIDIASRIDGFVAHVAAFREIEIIDIRPLPTPAHPNINFIQADLTMPNEIGVTDSLSCLHALEHFGLGRYSDAVDVNGHITGLINMIEMLEENGMFYLSVPVSTKETVHFNAHRVFGLDSLPDLQVIKNNLVLKRFDFVDDEGELHTDTHYSQIKGSVEYGCGIYTFQKISNGVLL